MGIASNKILQKYTHPTSHYVGTLLSAQNLSDSNFPEAAYALMHFRQRSLRGAELWPMWQQPHVMEGFWKIMQAMFQSRFMHLQGDGLYTALRIKVFAYLLSLIHI